MAADASARGVSLIETLVALSLIALVSAALLPAVAAAGRLYRESARESEAVRIAASRLDVLARSADAGAAGGSLTETQAGWSVFVDRAGAPVPAARAIYECRWRVTAGRLLVAAVRVVPVGGGDEVVLSTAVWRE